MLRRFHRAEKRKDGKENEREKKKKKKKKEKEKEDKGEDDATLSPPLLSLCEYLSVNPTEFLTSSSSSSSSSPLPSPASSSSAISRRSGRTSPGPMEGALSPAFLSVLEGALAAFKLMKTPRESLKVLIEEEEEEREEGREEGGEEGGEEGLLGGRVNQQHARVS